MGCRIVDNGQGSFGFVCSREKPKACVVCGQRATLLCDGPGLHGRKTCDAPLCGKHAKPIAKDEDLCPRCDASVKAKSNPPANDCEG